MNVIVLATASRVRGALTIYKQFISHLAQEKCEDDYYVFVNESMPKPQISRVRYIDMDTTSMLRRIRFDWNLCGKWLKKQGINPDVIVSLQNTGLYTDKPQLIYYHQSIPIYPEKWNILKSEERPLFFYKNVYPIFVRMTMNERTHYVVQIPFIKDGLIKMLNMAPERIHVMFPDVEHIDVKTFEPYNWGDDCLHFLYPANLARYKRHDTLIEALLRLENRDKIKLHITLKYGERPDLEELVKRYGLTDNVLFEGAIEHDKLLSMYKSSAGLLFPSQIETLGLPLLEAAACGIPIVASDKDYAHQVAGNYEGIFFVDANDYDGWAKAISRLSVEKKQYKPLLMKESSWPQFFELVRKSKKD